MYDSERAAAQRQESAHGQAWGHSEARQQHKPRAGQNGTSPGRGKAGARRHAADGRVAVLLSSHRFQVDALSDLRDSTFVYKESISASTKA